MPGAIGVYLGIFSHEEGFLLYPIAVAQISDMLKMPGVVGNKGETVDFAESGSQNVRILNGLFLVSEFNVNLRSRIQKRVIQLPDSKDIAKSGKFLETPVCLDSHKTPPYLIISDGANLYRIAGGQFIIGLLDDFLVLPQVKRDNI
jgi:hypothetical protein